MPNSCPSCPSTATWRMSGGAWSLSTTTRSSVVSRSQGRAEWNAAAAAAKARTRSIDIPGVSSSPGTGSSTSCSSNVRRASRTAGWSSATAIVVSRAASEVARASRRPGSRTSMRAGRPSSSFAHFKPNSSSVASASSGVASSPSFGEVHVHQAGAQADPDRAARPQRRPLGIRGVVDPHGQANDAALPGFSGALRQPSEPAERDGHRGGQRHEPTLADGTRSGPAGLAGLLRRR